MKFFPWQIFRSINKKNQNQNKSLRPKFHFSTPKGWCNDPNGFSQFGDKIHLFFQHHPYSTQWGPMHWGHAVTSDMLTWEQLPIALAPDTTADCKGCFSGTALEKDGKHYLVYTGVSNNGKFDIQNQCMAVGDGITYKKKLRNPVITAADIPFEFKITDFRDPKIWEKDGHFYMVCVLKQKDDTGAMVMFESEDAENWKYKGIVDYSKDGLSKMWECPDFTVVDGKDIMIFSPQEVKEDEKLGFHNGNNSVYVSGKFDYQECVFKRETREENGYTAAMVDYGIDFYAPQTTKLKDGRVIMIGWMQAWESYITPEDYNWSGMMTLPRELHFKNHRLYQTPVREYEELKKTAETVIIEREQKKQILKKQSRQFEVSFTLINQNAGKIRLTLGNEKENVILEIDTAERTLCFDRNNSRTPGAISKRKVKITTIEKDMALRIIVDTCSMEVFVNSGIMTFTNAFFMTEQVSDLWIESELESFSCLIQTLSFN